MPGAGGDGAGPRPLVLGMGWFPHVAGGLSRYVRQLTEAMLADGGPPPNVVVVGPAPDAPASVRAVSSEAVSLPLRLLRLARAARRAASSSMLLDSHFAIYALPCLLVPRIRRLPLVVHFHGPWADEFVADGASPGMRIAAKRRVERYVYRRAAALIVLSDAFAQILVRDFGIPADRVHVFAPGADLTRFAPGDRREARAQLAVADDAWVAVTARRLVPRVGIDVLLRAWAEVRVPGRVLLIVGEGPARPGLEALAAELGLERSVRFLGFVDDDTLVASYRAADVSVVPSVALEGFGLIVLEALACGTPVVATDVNGLPETLLPLDPSCVVPAGDVGALARRLQDAAEGSAPLPDGAACRRHAETFAWPDVARRHRVLYEQVAGRTLGSDPTTS